MRWIGARGDGPRRQIAHFIDQRPAVPVRRPTLPETHRAGYEYRVDLVAVA